MVCVFKNIGCGLAGGDWEHYEKALRDFEASYEGGNILVVDYLVNNKN